jgi:hypothetical protein
MWTPPPSLRNIPLIHAWRYKGSEGETLGWIARYEDENGKNIIPFFKKGSGGSFQIGAQEKPRSLYGLHLLSLYPNRGVLIVEGEKCAAALHQLKLVTVSPPMGANSVHNADFAPLNGTKKVCMLPDNDRAGANFITLVSKELAQLPSPPTMSRLDLPGLPPKGDIVDFIQGQIEWNGYSKIPEPARGELRNLIISLLRTATPIPFSNPAQEKMELSIPRPPPTIRFSGGDIKSTVKSMINLPDIVGEITTPTGQKGKWSHFICPFHEEEKGSFGCLKDYYHCFGCGAKGDSFSFVMRAYGCDFNEALKILVSKLGIQKST